MTLPAQRSQRVSKRTGVVLRVLLAAALLVPVGALFGATWQTNDERRSYADRERHGIEYLRALGQVTAALVDAQSGAMGGRAVPDEALRSAVEATSVLDLRYGADLRTTDRWTGVRAKIETLPERGDDPVTTSAAYAETSDLLLALYAKVRETSGLIRDPDPDSYYLQDAVAEELPEALIAAGRLADRTVLATRRPTEDPLRTAAELALARAAVLEPAGDLVTDLRLAVENTASRTLGGSLLSKLDGYQLAVEALAGLTADIRTADPARVQGARAAAQVAGAELGTIILAELDILVEVRATELADQRWLVLGSLLLALALILALVAGTVLAGRRTRPDGGPADNRTVGGLPVETNEMGPPPTGPPLSASPPSGSPLPTRTPLRDAAAGGPGPHERRPFGTDPIGEPSRRDPLPDWQERVPAGPVGQFSSGAPESQPTHWGRPDAR